MEASTTVISQIWEELPAWWLRQMRDLARAGGRPAAPGPDATIVEIRELGEDPSAASGVLLVRRGGQETLGAPFDLAREAAFSHAGPAATGLRLPCKMVLRREVVLPPAAGRDLATALRFEMDRLTPFDAAELFWGIANLRREPTRLRLTLLIAPREPVERLLSSLRNVGLTPTFLETDAGRIELSAGGTRAGAGRLAVYAVCGLLALLCLAIPMARQQLALDRVARQIAVLEPASRLAAALHGRLAAAASGETAVAAAQRNGDALKAIAGLTNALPDDTWLSYLALTSGNLTIDGQSANAARLIPLLAAAHLANPKFVAPVTRATGGKADLFSINATVAP